MPSKTNVAAAFAAATFALAACGGGGGDANQPNTAAFLTIVKSPVSGAVGQQPDAALLALGNRACADLDQGMRSDAVVNDLGGGTASGDDASALPGSSSFNGYSVVAAAAATELCPAHAAAFGGSSGIPLDP